MTSPVKAVWLPLCELAIALGAAPATKFPACWTHQVDAQWWVAMNAHQEAMPARSPVDPRRPPMMVPPYHCYVEFNGWPAGLFNPFGGVIAGGQEANEDTLIAALTAAVEQVSRKG